jgi:hypothetical protein
MKQILGEDWKTSALGLLAGAVLILQDYAQQGETNVYKISLGVLVFLLGRFAADQHK